MDVDTQLLGCARMSNATFQGFFMLMSMSYTQSAALPFRAVLRKSDCYILASMGQKLEGTLFNPRQGTEN
eukprot:1157444-Pelagomonas_calceolata.AAC.2